MSEAIQEVGWGFLCVVSETGINVDEMLTEVVGVGDGILSVDFICFDVEHVSLMYRRGMRSYRRSAEGVRRGIVTIFYRGIR